MPARRVSPEMEFKRTLAYAIRKNMKVENLSISALAQRMGTGRTAVRRILDVRNTSFHEPRCQCRRVKNQARRRTDVAKGTGKARLSTRTE